MEVLISSSTLRANQDYELHLFTAQYDEDELQKNIHKAQEFALNSS